MERERSHEIIAAYGADPARWPPEEREGVRKALSSDLTLRRQADEAAGMDALLTGWATRETAGGDAWAAADAALAAADRMPARRNWAARAFGGFAAVAAVAVALVLSPNLTETATAPAQQTAAATTTTPAPTQTASVDSVDHRLWAMTFTPTPDEETLI